MAATLGALLQERSSSIVGRERERARLAELLQEGGPVVAHVHGLGGVGKTTLLHAFEACARTLGAEPVYVDAHGVYATQGSFLASFGASDVEEAADALGARGDRVVLLVDTYEILQAIDPWIARTFVPALPAHVRVVFAGREAPGRHWSAYGPLLTPLPLGNLPHEDAVALLRDNGVDDGTANRINHLCHGHALSLQLAAWALKDRPGAALEAIAAGAVGEELARLYLDGLDVPTRRAVDAAALTRRTTLSLLEAMLPDEDAKAAYERLRALPFVELDADGLVVHDTIREATAALLRAADPPEYWRLRAAAWERLRAELRGAPKRDLWRYTADMMYLIEDKAVRAVFFPPAAGEHRVDAGRAADLDAIQALAPDFDLLREWWDAAPEAFVVTRDEAGAASGFAILAEPSAVSARLLDRDPLARGWREHLRRNPVPREQQTRFMRRIVGDYGPSAAALFLDVTRRFVELRPALRRVYAPATDLVDADPSCSLVMGYLPLDGEPDSVCVDFGPASVDGWLAELGARQLRVEADDLPIEGLTRLEAGVLAYLRSREGRPVERADLLRDVWGYDWDGGSNVVDVVVSALRRKLGDRADTLETVRGVGYRLTA
jgi:hypothetical protein